jgi:site-specific recombinase XerD
MTIERLRQGPLATYLDPYVAAQLQQGYRPKSIARQIVTVSEFSRWLQRKQIAVADLDNSIVDRFLGVRQREGRLSRGGPKALTRLVELLCEKGAIPVRAKPVPEDTCSKVVGEYQLHLTEERGLSASTLLNYIPVVEQFLSRRFRNRTPDFSVLSARDITGFVLRQASQLSPLRAGLAVTALRSFLRYLRVREMIAHDLAACVPTVPSWSLSTLPRFLPTREVERVLKCCDRKTTAGRRNYAILLLLARLGLRACEVVGLNLEDIDWRIGQITIRAKGGRSAQLPLVADVGDAIASYLRNDRPQCSTRRVFVRDRAPLTGLGNSSTVSSLVRRALQKVGIESAHMGAHVLRHSLATNLLRQGGSLDEIGELLRHQSPNTTAIYAKVDIVALHTLALPWPGGGR